MKGSRLFAVVGLCVALVGARAFAAEPPRDVPGGGIEGSWPTRLKPVSALIDETLRASGIEDRAEIEHYSRLFHERLRELEKKVGHPRSVYRRARRLHDALHAKVFKRYLVTADGMNAILDRGEYNCVSATLFWGIAARAFDLRVQVVESPRHIFLRLPIPTRHVEIECTSPTGFDLRRDLDRFRSFALAYKFATPEEMERRGIYSMFQEFHGLVEPVSLESASAFIWHNTAERALARGEGLRAASAFIEEHRLHPELATRSDGFATSLARAFRIVYEEGRFEDAYRIVEMEIAIFPRKTTTRDRLLAAASKKIQIASEKGDAAVAESILDRAAGVLTEPGDLVRLEREICPHIAAAAVRSQDWERARRIGRRFAGAEPDGVESSRFIAWIELRAQGGHEEASTQAGERPMGSGTGSPGAFHP